jgi:adenylate cyclase
MTMVERDVEEYFGAILFTDLVGFTEYNDGVGDVAALRVLESQSAIVKGVLEGVDNARVVKEIGDGLMIWFPSAAGGIRCAIQLMKLIEQERAHSRFPLALRMGMHFGSALARGSDLIGQSVNVAARVSDIAGPGELLVSGELLAALSVDSAKLTMHAVGPVRVKGVQRPIWIHRVSTLDLSK